jgi:hypothetical protein
MKTTSCKIAWQIAKDLVRKEGLSVQEAIERATKYKGENHPDIKGLFVVHKAASNEVN